MRWVEKTGVSSLDTLQVSPIDHGQRQNMYKQGGLVSVTSRILVVDMLQSDVPIELITGIVILHAEKYVLPMYMYVPRN